MSSRQTVLIIPTGDEEPLSGAGGALAARDATNGPWQPTQWSLKSALPRSAFWASTAPRYSDGHAGGCSFYSASTIVYRLSTSAVERKRCSGGSARPYRSTSAYFAPTPIDSPMFLAIGWLTDALYCTQSNFQMFQSGGGGAGAPPFLLL